MFSQGLLLLDFLKEACFVFRSVVSEMDICVCDIISLAF